MELRENAHPCQNQFCEEAAAEIRRLRGERDHLRREMQANPLHLKNEELKREADQLRARVAELTPTVCTCDRFASHHAPTCRTITG